MTILLDTTALVDILEGTPPASKLRDRLARETAFTTQINVFELLVGVYALRTNREKRLEQAERLFSRLHVLELTDTASRMAARIQGELYRKGTPIDDTDCLTAAIAIIHGVPTILTRNKKHFDRIPRIAVESY